MATTNIVGKCPACWSEYITYGDAVFTDEAVYYPVVCDECGAESKEWYKLVFVEIISDEQTD